MVKISDLSKLEWLPASSSNIYQSAWDDDTLYIEFHSGGTYAYSNVPKSLHDGLLAAESPGRFAQEEIIGKFPFRKIG